MLVLGGLSKWTASEAEGIRSWMEHSPFLSWIYRATSVQGASIVIGIIEIATALAIVARHWAPRLSAAGSASAIVMFLFTLSFLVTTPNQGPDAQGFLIKDLFLLGAAMWSCGEAMEASNQ